MARGLADRKGQPITDTKEEILIARKLNLQLTHREFTCTKFTQSLNSLIRKEKKKAKPPIFWRKLNPDKIQEIFQ